MKELQIFKNEKFGEIRTIEENAKVLFCGSDVAKSLGYAIPSKAINTHCKGVSKMEVPTNGGKQEMLFISEGDIYRLAAKSKLQGAEEFESWIFDEVLPSIRKHGAYMTDVTVDKMIASPEFGIQLLIALKEEKAKRNALELENTQQKQIIGELKPKADYTDMILQNKSLVTITQIAKDYGKGGGTMNKLLHDLGVQYCQSGQWLLYSKYHSCGYTHSETIKFKHSDGRPDVKMQTKWTQKGRLFLYNLLKRHGYLPVIEQTHDDEYIA